MLRLTAYWISFEVFPDKKSSMAMGIIDSVRLFRIGGSLSSVSLESVSSIWIVGDLRICGAIWCPWESFEGEKAGSL